MMLTQQPINTLDDEPNILLVTALNLNTPMIACFSNHYTMLG